MNDHFRAALASFRAVKLAAPSPAPSIDAVKLIDLAGRAARAEPITPAEEELLRAASSPPVNGPRETLVSDPNAVARFIVEAGRQANGEA